MSLRKDDPKCKNYKTKTKRQNNIMIGKTVAKRNNYAFK